MIQILLVDDHPLVVEGTKLIIENEQDMKVHIETSSVRALELVKTQKFDVMLFDLQMPEMDGFELAKNVLKMEPAANILIYSGYEIMPHLELLMESGAIGFISKTATRDQLIRAIRCAINQEVVLPFSILKEIYMLGRSSNKRVKETKDPLMLTEKERNILKELTKGKTNKEMAQKLYMGQRSLEYSLTSLFHKLGVQTRIEAVVKANELGLLDS
ncbi:response regulator transcription factor [Bacillus sp. ISL-18]|uniref:response regulator transcription factor n=1 Tax=Bacillus sp. ISL-18 TaxID=2819118 RepID=UPI001BE8B14C|nr:response regulator transcription factor [Bacillus sp. ISL-18]MBT2657848.1 response regulator transcription factor [Bacillus sp. ISL-18]